MTSILCMEARVYVCEFVVFGVLEACLQLIIKPVATVDDTKRHLFEIPSVLSSNNTNRTPSTSSELVSLNATAVPSFLPHLLSLGSYTNLSGLLTLHGTTDVS